MQIRPKYKIIESEKVSALWCNGSTFTRQVRDPGLTPGGANTAKYKIIESEKVSALWCNGSTFTRQVRDPGSTPGGASTFCDSIYPLDSSASLTLSLGNHMKELAQRSNSIFFLWFHASNGSFRQSFNFSIGVLTFDPKLKNSCLTSLDQDQSM
ncbi:hypothetical protein J6590_010737 [Homalodisca vitripennis]|nr:hypothetical protein J6590_010737 [Homalodisca vitripennis]